MKIISQITPPDSIEFSNLEIGEVFLDLDLESPCMKIRDCIDAETPTSTYTNNAIDLSDGGLYHCDPDETVRRIRAELVISNL